MPSLSKNADPGCDHGMAKAISFGIDTNFIVAILVCVLILLILLVAVVVHRRKTDDLYKDMDDIRENIINYEDEGGGEVDTGYDLNVLRAIYDAPPIDSKIAPIGLQGRGTIMANTIKVLFTLWIVVRKLKGYFSIKEPTKFQTFVAS